MQTTFSILTFNTGLLYAPVFGRCIGTRFLCPIGSFYTRREKMAQEILHTDADIICLQEIGHEKDKEYFVKNLKSIYPYVKYDSRKAWLRFPNAEMIFSKFPITEHVLYQFKERPWTEWFLRKGFTVSTFNINDKNIIIVHTHGTIGGRPNAAHTLCTIDTQKKHMAYMLKLLEQYKVDILLGDLNTGPEYRSTSYTILMNNNYRSIFEILTPETMLPFTYSATYCNAEGKMFMEPKEYVLDHILLYKNSALVPAEAYIMFKGQGISDHLGILGKFNT